MRGNARLHFDPADARFGCSRCGAVLTFRQFNALLRGTPSAHKCLDRNSKPAPPPAERPEPIPLSYGEPERT